MGDDVYIADDGLEEDCLDPEVIGYIQITNATPPHFPTAPCGSSVVGIAMLSHLATAIKQSVKFSLWRVLFLHYE